MATNIFRGASAEQDSRFSDKQKKLLKTTKFPANFDTKVDMKKVDMESLMPWVTEQVSKLLGFEDDVVVGYVKSSLEKPKVDPKEMQLSLAGFLNKHTPGFMKELWSLLVSAQDSPGGVPKEFSAKKEEELRQRKIDQERIEAELQAKKVEFEAMVAAEEKRRSEEGASASTDKPEERRGDEGRDRRGAERERDRRYEDERRHDDRRYDDRHDRRRHDDGYSRRDRHSERDRRDDYHRDRRSRRDDHYYDRRDRSYLKCPLLDDSAPPARLDYLKTQAAPSHPRAAPEQLGGLPWPQQPASGRPKSRAEDVPRSTTRRDRDYDRRDRDRRDYDRRDDRRDGERRQRDEEDDGPDPFGRDPRPREGGARSEAEPEEEAGAGAAEGGAEGAAATTDGGEDGDAKGAGEDKMATD